MGLHDLLIRKIRELTAEGRQPYEYVLNPERKGAYGALFDGKLAVPWPPTGPHVIVSHDGVEVAIRYTEPGE